MVVESFVEKRKRELREKNGGGTESASSFIERRKKELRGEVKTPEQQQKSSVTSQVLKDTLSGVMKQQPVPQKEPYAVDFKAEQAKNKTAEVVPSIRLTPKETPTLQDKIPAPQLLQTSQGIQSTLKDKVPAANLVHQTGRGPANASDIPGVSQYEITKKEISDDNAPDAVKAYANIMNYITQGNPAGVAASRAFAGNSGATRRDTTKFPVIDKVTDAINDFVTPFITPTGAPVGSGPNMAPYEAANKVLNTGIGQKYVNYAANSLINRGLIPKGSSEIAGRVAAGTVGETLAGPLQNVAAGLINGQDSNQEIINNAQIGLGAGLGLGYAGSIVSEGFTTALGKVMKKAGRSDSEVAETLEAVNTPQAEVVPQSEIKTNLPETNPLALPQSPELLALPPGRSTSTSARIEQRQNVYRQKFENLIAEAQKRSFTPGREDLELENLWSQMADRTDPSLNELIDLAYPKRTAVPQKGMIGAARANQEMREVAGVGNPVKSSAPQVFADAAQPKQVIAKVGTTGTAKEGAIRSSSLTREQEIMNKVNAKQPLTQADIEFAQSAEFDKNKLFPENTPEKSTYVKPTIKTEVARVEPKAEVKTKVKAEPVAKKTIVTEVKKVSKLSTVPEKKTPGIRANFKTMTDSKAISSTLKGKIAKLDQTYQASKNADVLANSNEALKDLAKVESDFLKSGSSGAQHISNGYRAMQELDKAGEHARALAIADKLAKDLTEAGQTVQAASLISRLSPEGQLLNLIRTAEKNGKVVDVADSVKFKNLAEKVQETTGAGKEENSIADILNRLEQGGANADDIKALGDYLKSAESKIKAKPVKDRLPNELKDSRARDKVVSFLEAQEAAAQARINKRRGRLNSLPVDEWIDYSILIAAKVGKGIIKAETYAEDLVKLFGEDIRPIARQVFEKAQELVGSVTKGSIEGDFIKADNAFKRITGKSSMNQQERIVEKYVAANPQVTPKDIESLRKLSKSLTDLQGLERTQADMAMQKILNSYEKSSIMDKVNAIRYIAMLFNSGTQAINAISGPAMATTARVADMFGVMIDSTLSTILKTPRTTTLYGANPVKFTAEYFKALKTGAKAGWEGVNPAGIQGSNEIRGLTYKGKYNPLSYLERSLGAVAKGADYATYSAIYKGEMEKQGFLDALENGIKRSNKDAIKQHIRKFVNDPPEAALEQADRIAKNSTFQRNDTLGGETANWLNSGSGKVQKVVSPVVRTVFPFVRTPINIASTAVTMTPGGIIKGLIQLSSKSNATQREAIRTLSLGLTGTGLSAIGFYLNQLGIITGSNDSGDKNVDNIREQVGKGKYRFNTSALQRYVGALLDGKGADAAEKAAKYQEGDKQFDYNKLQPLAFPLAIGAEASALKGKPNQVTGTVSGAAGSLFGMSTLRGVQDVFQPQFGGTQGEKATGVATRLGESFLKSFSPSMLAQEARRQDPVMRKTAYNDGIVADVKDYYKSRIPGLSESLPANKTTLGQDKLNAPGIKGQYLNPYKSEVARYTQAGQFIVDLMERTGDTSIAPSAPAKKVRGKNENDESVTISIPPKRYEKLQEDIGNEIINRVMEIEGGTDEELITQLEEIYSEVRKEYMDEVKEELGLQVN
jgi:hypothetical protein